MKIWLPVNDALNKYSQYRHLITASNYITPFNVVSEQDVKLNFNSPGKVNIFSKTPSIGGIWATHPSFKYVSGQNNLMGESSVFAKVSTEENILVEMKNLLKMKKFIFVPEVLGFFRNRIKDLSELHEMKPGCKIAALLVEEFIDSISLGQAIVDERIDIDSVVESVINTLYVMHNYCAHRDLKHSHIRINLDPETIEELMMGFREDLNLEIEGVSIIDVETTKMRWEFSGDEFEPSVQRDITQLLTSINGYLSTLENDTEAIRRYFPTPIHKRLERFGALLDQLKLEYEVKVPQHFLRDSITTRFLIKRLGS
ncbi:MAG: hypothetical protein JSW00_08135 [Thermoplasmata archaeon]|nr:MAG: hypothetical protein JSW00_08135 [Thermoplasmata archaeon]